MITVTETAKDELLRIMQSRGLPLDKFLRLATPPLWTGEGDWGIVISDEGSNDYAIHHKDEVVLLIQSIVAQDMSEAILDFKETPQGAGFTLDVY